MGKHSDAMQEAMALRGFAPKTRKVYLAWMRRLVNQSGKTADELVESDLRAFLVGLTEGKRSVSTFNQAISAFAFFYREVVPREWSLLPRYQRPPQRLPMTMSADEVRRLLDAATSLRERAMMELAYSSGLRLGEVLRLKITDIDSGRMIIRVERGKGGKDRERDAGRFAPGDAACLLETGQASPLAVSGPGGRPAAESDHPAASVYGSESQSANRQAGQLPFFAAQLCHASFGSRRQRAHDPSLARPPQPWHHRAVHACGG